MERASAIQAHGAIHNRRNIIKGAEIHTAVTELETSDNSRRIMQFQNFEW